MPAHKSIGKKNYNAIKKNDQKYEPLMRHFKYLKNLGEVRATRVVATLVNGMQGHTNCNDSINMTYLPISMGYRSCYKRYMASLGYTVRTMEMGAFIVTRGDGMEVDAGEYCSFPIYLILWKRDLPDLKVSQPVEDICKDCYAFATRHRYLANCTMGFNNDDGEGNGNGDGNSNGDNDNNASCGNGKGKFSNDRRSNDGSNNDGSRTFPMLESAQLGTLTSTVWMRHQ